MALCNQTGPHTCPFASCDHASEPHRTTETKVIEAAQVQALANFAAKRGGWINAKSLKIILELTLQGVSPAEAFEKAISQVFG